jgi:hypothetical protein
METKPTGQEVEGDALSSGVTNRPTNETVNGNGVVEKDHAITDSSQLEKGIAGELLLSPEHRDYLMARHGTVDLAPLPTMDPADPLNWPAWKVISSMKFWSTN